MKASMVVVMFVLNFYKTFTFWSYFLLFFCVLYVLRGEKHKREQNSYLAPFLTEVGYETLTKLTSGR